MQVIKFFHFALLVSVYTEIHCQSINTAFPHCQHPFPFEPLQSRHVLVGVSLVFQTLEYAIIIIFIAKDRLSFNNEKDVCSDTNNLFFNFFNVNGYVS